MSNGLRNMRKLRVYAARRALVQSCKVVSPAMAMTFQPSCRALLKTKKPNLKKEGGRGLGNSMDPVPMNWIFNFAESSGAVCGHGSCELSLRQPSTGEGQELGQQKANPE
eukprot:8724636-Pyramimonas_sp.AAC.1